MFTTVVGPFKQASTAKDKPLPGQGGTEHLELTPEPVDSQSSSSQTRRTVSEPVTRPSQPRHQQLHICGVKLKVCSDENLDTSRIKKRKPGTETS